MQQPHVRTHARTLSLSLTRVLNFVDATARAQQLQTNGMHARANILQKAQWARPQCMLNDVYPRTGFPPPGLT